MPGAPKAGIDWWHQPRVGGRDGGGRCVAQTEDPAPPPIGLTKGFCLILHRRVTASARRGITRKGSHMPQDTVGIIKTPEPVIAPLRCGQVAYAPALAHGGVMPLFLLESPNTRTWDGLVPGTSRFRSSIPTLRRRKKSKKVGVCGEPCLIGIANPPWGEGGAPFPRPPVACGPRSLDVTGSRRRWRELE